MLRPRIIPALLLADGGLVKTQKFKSPVYLGDPTNVIKIFNTKEVDEVIVLDIAASERRRAPELDAIKLFADECFMPVCFGGGITKLAQAEKIVGMGIEKLSFNTSALFQPDLIRDVVRSIGSSAVVGAIDISKDLLGRTRVYAQRGRKNTGKDPVEYAKYLEGLGCGELLVNSIDRDGAMNGYDLLTISAIAKSVQIPVIALGGAGNLLHMAQALEAGAQAAAAGSLFVFEGPNRAVLISYPDPKDLNKLVLNK